MTTGMGQARPREPFRDGVEKHAWRRRAALAVFATAAAYFLLTEHYAHTIRALPWVLLLACPLMHVFMHRGHTGHGREDGKR